MKKYFIFIFKNDRVRAYQYLPEKMLHTIFLIGNPNVGKTSLFNVLTGSHEQTANFSGTTVDAKSCISKNTHHAQMPHFRIVDLPGIHAFNSKKGEENFAWKNIEKAMAEENAIFIQVINSGEWKKSLHLTLDLQKKGICPILFFNTKKSDKNLGEEFYKKIEKEFSLSVFRGNIESKNFERCFWEKFFLAKTTKQQNTCPLPKTFASPSEQNDYIEKLFQTAKQKSFWSNFLDTVFLHSFFGILVFFLLLFLLFQATFSLGALPMDWIDSGVSHLQESARQILGTGLLASFFIDGIIAGVGGTLIFLPNILILFFFLSLLKESGYLARTSFLFDVFFQKIGISGRASIPLLMGFGCNVPSIMAIKMFESKKEQIIVAMMTLFMSCGARLPVYTLLISAFIPENFQAISLFSIYILGIGVAFMTGKILSVAYKRKQRTSLIAHQMPALLFPQWKKAVQYAWQKGKDFAINVGKFIVPVSAILWVLFTFPLQNNAPAEIENSYGASIGKTIAPIFSPMDFDWKISTALLSGLAAKEVMVTTFSQLYSSQNSEELVQENIKNSGDFSLPSALALLVFTLLYTPCVAVLGVIRKELGNKWTIVATIYPSAIAWIFSFFTFHITLFFL
jgi:ferrous iron transport protein B